MLKIKKKNLPLKFIKLNKLRYHSIKKNTNFFKKKDNLIVKKMNYSRTNFKKEKKLRVINLNLLKRNYNNIKLLKKHEIKNKIVFIKSLKTIESRLDIFVKNLYNISINSAQLLINHNYILVNGKTENSCNVILLPSDFVCLNLNKFINKKKKTLPYLSFFSKKYNLSTLINKIYSKNLKKNIYIIKKFHQILTINFSLYNKLNNKIYYNKKLNFILKKKILLNFLNSLFDTKLDTKINFLNNQKDLKMMNVNFYDFIQIKKKIIIPFGTEDRTSFFNKHYKIVFNFLLNNSLYFIIIKNKINFLLNLSLYNNISHILLKKYIKRFIKNLIFNKKKIAKTFANYYDLLLFNNNMFLYSLNILLLNNNKIFKEYNRFDNKFIINLLLITMWYDNWRNCNVIQHYNMSLSSIRYNKIKKNNLNFLFLKNKNLYNIINKEFKFKNAMFLLEKKKKSTLNSSSLFLNKQTINKLLGSLVNSRNKNQKILTFHFKQLTNKKSKYFYNNQPLKYFFNKKRYYLPINWLNLRKKDTSSYQFKSKKTHVSFFLVRKFINYCSILFKNFKNQNYNKQKYIYSVLLKNFNVLKSLKKKNGPIIPYKLKKKKKNNLYLKKEYNHLFFNLYKILKLSTNNVKTIKDDIFFNTFKKKPNNLKVRREFSNKNLNYIRYNIRDIRLIEFLNIKTLFKQIHKRKKKKNSKLDDLYIKLFLSFTKFFFINKKSIFGTDLFTRLYIKPRKHNFFNNIFYLNKYFFNKKYNEYNRLLSYYFNRIQKKKKKIFRTSTIENKSDLKDNTSVHQNKNKNFFHLKKNHLKNQIKEKIFNKVNRRFKYTNNLQNLFLSINDTYLKNQIEKKDLCFLNKYQKKDFKLINNNRDYKNINYFFSFFKMKHRNNITLRMLNNSKRSKELVKKLIIGIDNHPFNYSNYRESFNKFFVERDNNFYRKYTLIPYIKPHVMSDDLLEAVYLLLTRRINNQSLLNNFVKNEYLLESNTKFNEIQAYKKYMRIAKISYKIPFDFSKDKNQTYKEKPYYGILKRFKSNLIINSDDFFNYLKEITKLLIDYHFNYKYTLSSKYSILNDTNVMHELKMLKQFHRTKFSEKLFIMKYQSDHVLQHFHFDNFNQFILLFFQQISIKFLEKIGNIINYKYQDGFITNHEIMFLLKKFNTIFSGFDLYKKKINVNKSHNILKKELHFYTKQKQIKEKIKNYVFLKKNYKLNISKIALYNKKNIEIKQFPLIYTKLFYLNKYVRTGFFNMDDYNKNVKIFGYTNNLKNIKRINFQHQMLFNFKKYFSDIKMRFTNNIFLHDKKSLKSFESNLFKILHTHNKEFRQFKDYDLKNKAKYGSFFNYLHLKKKMNKNLLFTNNKLITKYKSFIYHPFKLNSNKNILNLYAQIYLKKKFYINRLIKLYYNIFYLNKKYYNIITKPLVYLKKMITEKKLELKFLKLKINFKSLNITFKKKKKIITNISKSFKIKNYLKKYFMEIYKNYLLFYKLNNLTNKQLLKIVFTKSKKINSIKIFMLFKNMLLKKLKNKNEFKFLLKYRKNTLIFLIRSLLNKKCFFYKNIIKKKLFNMSFFMFFLKNKLYKNIKTKYFKTYNILNKNIYKLYSQNLQKKLFKEHINNIFIQQKNKKISKLFNFRNYKKKFKSFSPYFYTFTYPTITPIKKKIIINKKDKKDIKHEFEQKEAFKELKLKEFYSNELNDSSNRIFKSILTNLKQKHRTIESEYNKEKKERLKNLKNRQYKNDKKIIPLYFYNSKMFENSFNNYQQNLKNNTKNYVNIKKKLFSEPFKLQSNLNKNTYSMIILRFFLMKHNKNLKNSLNFLNNIKSKKDFFIFFKKFNNIKTHLFEKNKFFNFYKLYKNFFKKRKKSSKFSNVDKLNTYKPHINVRKAPFHLTFQNQKIKKNLEKLLLKFLTSLNKKIKNKKNQLFSKLIYLFYKKNILNNQLIKQLFDIIIKKYILQLKKNYNIIRILEKKYKKYLGTLMYKKIHKASADQTFRNFPIGVYNRLLKKFPLNKNKKHLIKKNIYILWKEYLIKYLENFQKKQYIEIYPEILGGVFIRKPELHELNLKDNPIFLKNIKENKNIVKQIQLYNKKIFENYLQKNENNTKLADILKNNCFDIALYKKKSINNLIYNNLLPIKNTKRQFC